MGEQVNDIYPGSDWTRLDSNLLVPPSSLAARNTVSPMPPILFYSEGISYSAYVNLAIRENLNYEASVSYLTEASILPNKLPGDVVFSSEGGPEHHVLLRVDDAVLLVMLSSRGGGTFVSFYAAARDAVTARALVFRVKQLVKERVATEDPNRIDVKFWTNSTPPRPILRTITAPPFEEIADNYNAEARHVLDHMMSPEFVAGSGGQLILWHGPPGTGKTYALRALAQAWRTWCDIEYVVDPEQFFGDANYLMPVMLNNSDPYNHGKDRWRLLIFEDTGELLAANARARTGQGLSRLLNVVDGFVGQGLRTLILITTNEDFEKLHPAVTRPGRCAIKAHFGPLPAKQAKEWGERHKIEVTGDHTLAELFALRDGAFNDEVAPLSRPIGFNPDVRYIPA